MDGVCAVLQVRTTSTRLPGKALLPLAGSPMVLRQLERVDRSGRVDQVVVATSTDASDDELAAALAAAGYAVFRGSLDDVLDRFYRAAEGCSAAHIVRLTGDCPLSDPDVIDSVVDLHLKDSNDYTSNTLRPTMPDGLDVEVITSEALSEAWNESEESAEREHVTPFVWRRPDRYRLGSWETGRDLSHMRWTVDEPSDYEFVSRVYEELYPSDPAFTTQDVLDLLERQPDLATMNAHIERNEGLRQSMAEESADVTDGG